MKFPEANLFVWPGTPVVTLQLMFSSLSIPSGRRFPAAGRQASAGSNVADGFEKKETDCRELLPALEHWMP